MNLFCKLFAWLGCSCGLLSIYALMRHEMGAVEFVIAVIVSMIISGGLIEWSHREDALYDDSGN